jgi:hypothetical protein
MYSIAISSQTQNTLRTLREFATSDTGSALRFRNASFRRTATQAMERSSEGRGHGVIDIIAKQAGRPAVVESDVSGSRLFAIAAEFGKMLIMEPNRSEFAPQRSSVEVRMPARRRKPTYVDQRLNLG